ncbi:MAG: hypothetical protein F4Y45_13455 [Acidobacteria bacterium]|nr:hypothetical protein [Acidobacteriota bacterium]MYJ04459.1 hypothetical protein [Acidobacteriota bacterium]
MSVLLFILLEVVFAPLQTIGSLIYALRVRFVNMPRGISGTAYEPYMTRLMLHHTGRRSDEAAEKIALHLPALPPLVLRLLMGTLVLAVKWSLAPGSRIAIDYLSRELVFGRRPFVVMGNYAKYAMKAFYNESWLFGISTAAPAREPARKFIESRGLELQRFEAFAGEAGRGTPLGGLIVAGVPENRSQ